MDDKRLISEERGKNVANDNGIKFFETSAKDNINIEQAFITLAEDILNKQSPGREVAGEGGEVKLDETKAKGNPNACCAKF